MEETDVIMKLSFRHAKISFLLYTNYTVLKALLIILLLRNINILTAASYSLEET